MQTQVLQENFSKALSSVSRFASSRAQLPILGNILLKADKTKLTVSATNLEISASISIGAQTEKEGEITIPAKIITEVLGSLSTGPVSLTAEKEQLKVKTGSFSSTILGMNSVDFPVIPSLIETKKAEIFPLKEFKKALSSVLFAASIDETRPTLTGVLLLLDKKDLVLVATDGFRLSQKKLKLSTEHKVQQIILPKSVLLEVLRISEEEGDLLLQYSPTEKQVTLGIDKTILSSRIIEGDFPSFEKIIPKESSTKIRLEKSELARAVKLASVFARESANIIKIETKKDGIKITAESASAGNQEAAVEATVEGPQVEIAFNFRFLEDLLHAAGGDEVAIGLTNGDSPAVFTDPTDSAFLHLIMPVRIQS